jgi:hypothetical protein
MSYKNDFIDTTTQVKIIRDLSEKLLKHYIFPEKAEQIGKYLQQCMSEGEYGDINEGNLFALALTMHMQEESHDEHLWVRWHQEALPEHETELRFNPEWQAARKQEAEATNFGISVSDRLPGNVGYLDIHYFHRPEWGGEAMVCAMQLMSLT